MKLIVGLGNPGKQYQNTRHNVGFMVVDRLAAIPQLGCGAWRMNKKFNAECAKSNNGELLLLKPLTFMNESGKAVQAVLNFYKLLPAEIYVLHDDLDVPFGSYKIQKNRGSAGHHGIESLIAHLGTRDFTRVRIGIHNDEPRREGADFVLASFNKTETKKLPALLDGIIQDLLAYL